MSTQTPSEARAFAGKAALVTGASRGIGAAIARRLHADGARVALASRSGDDLGLPDVVAQPCDVRSREDLQSITDAAVERFDGLDIAVVNAGVGSYGDFLDLPVEQLDEIVDVNVKGTLYAAQAVLPHLLRSNAADLLVIASVAGQRGPEGESVYAASKFAQVGFLRALDHELWPKGVRCQCLCPGGVATDFALGRGRTPDDPDLANFMQADEVGAVAVDLLRLPRSQRVIESTLLPMAEDSLG
jgi:NAD(P)-dependent dehydrogenase (short-subunit alcohol dehydrogenase family)